MRRAACAIARRVLGELANRFVLALALGLALVLGSAGLAPAVRAQAALVQPAIAGEATTRLLPAALLGTASARFDEPRGQDTLAIPPSPSRVAPRLALEVHTGLTLPLDNAALCPEGAGCVLEGGGGVGVSIERRWPSGFGGLLAYDAWFLDSDSVFELAVQQQLRGGIRYTMPTDYVFHPIFELSIGMMGLGDIFRLSTGGLLMQAFSGVETELTESVGVRMGMGLRAFSHSAFRTARDGVQRGEGGRFSEAFFFEVGLTVM